MLVLLQERKCSVCKVIGLYANLKSILYLSLVYARNQMCWIYSSDFASL